MVARSAIISDALLKDLIAAGQADIVVGMATFNDAATLSRVLDAVLEAFTTTLLRERTVLVAADGGSGDGTLEVVRGTAPSEARRPFRHPLRTVHRIAGVYSGIPSAKTALRVLLAAAELLDTRSLILVDAADVALTAPEITAFALATFKDGCDLVTPVLPRGPADGPLVTQLVRPVIRALWGRRIAEPLTMPMACSGRLAADMGRRTPWAHLPGRLAGELWVTSHGLCDGWRARQIAIAERPQGSTRRGGLVEIFSDITATL